MFCFRFPSFSRPDFSRPIAASSQLSDPRCFRFLSSASVLGSDYSASVSSVPVLPVLASQGLPRCSVSAFASTVFHFPSAWFPMLSSSFSVLSTTVCFLSLYPASLPQPFHRCIPSLSFRYFPLHCCFLSSASDPLSVTQLSVSSVPLDPRFRLTVASSLHPFRLHFPAFLLPIYPVSRVSLPSLSTWLPFVSFRPSQLRSHGRSAGAHLSFLPGVRPLHPLSFVRFCFRL